ncbi:MAG: hypothetical protein MZV64_07975 [Ignavibacteriales bacterium]|nr:hypothetical protein [Ignavibacteriales bacterium]
MQHFKEHVSSYRFEKRGYSYIFYNLRLDDVELVSWSSSSGSNHVCFMMEVQFIPIKKFLWKHCRKGKYICLWYKSKVSFDVLKNLDYIPKDNCDLSSLKTILSTGSPLSDENFKWVYSKM